MNAPTWKKVHSRGFHTCAACRWPIYPGEEYYRDADGCTFSPGTMLWDRLPVKKCIFCARHGNSTLKAPGEFVEDLIQHFFCEGYGLPIQLVGWCFTGVEEARQAEWVRIKASPEWAKINQRRLGL